MSESLVRIGKIVGCHGVRGDLKIRPSSEDAEWLKNLRSVTLKLDKAGKEAVFTIKTSRRQGPLVILNFSELPDRTAAELWVGAALYAEHSELPEPDEGEYWVDDLIGLAVIDAQNHRKRGVVKDLLSATGTDFLEIQLEDSNQTVVIPFIDKFFPEVNLEAGTVSIDLLSDFLSMETQPTTSDRLKQ